MTRKAENQAFRCAACGAANPPIASGTIRDHCRVCLTSLHVDVVPGDRACECRGQLVATAAQVDARRGFLLHFRCDTCGAVKRNRAAHDDNTDRVIELLGRPVREP